MSQKNTLFKYFTSSPSTPNGLKKNSEKSPLVSKSSTKKSKEKGSETKSINNKKSPTGVLNGTSTHNKPGKSVKKKLISEEEGSTNELSESLEKSASPIPELEDSGDEYVPPDNLGESEDSSDSGASEEEPETPSDEESPVKKGSRKRKRSPSSASKPNKKSFLAKITPSKNNIVGTPSVKPVADNSNGTENEGNWSHLKYDFLKPEKIKDGKGKKPDHPEYDSRTLYVPDDFLRSQTPAMRQWWEMKSKNYDSILFFKLGKFYELYHMDAMVGTKELSISFMKGDSAHCGFPEIAYGRFASNLVDKGYKVARVEQTETPDMMTDRTKKLHKPTKFDKVVRREICQVTTKGTRMFSVTEGNAEDADSKYLLAIIEKELDGVKSSYGVCFIDTSIGVFHIGQFEDDRNSSRLRTLIAVYPPVQVLFERNGLTKRTQQILNNALCKALKEQLSPVTEFWTSSDTLTQLNERKYFSNGKLPETLQSFVGEVDSLGLIASSESEMGVRALGALVWYLTKSLIDYQLLSMGQFEVYVPIDVDIPLENIEKKHEIQNRNMVLDAVTLKNLNVLDNGSGGKQGSLIHRIEHCCTAFGKRLFHQWLCSPLTNIKSIEVRQEAVRVLRENQSILSKASDLLLKVPDLERLFSRIYSQSSKGLEESHPENRAIFFEEKIYSKRKITEFISVLNGFQKLQEVAELIQETGVCEESKLLRSCGNFKTDTGNFPDLREHLSFFKSAFDHEEAEKEGKIIPSEGVDAEYDEAVTELSEIDKDLKKYLKSQCDHFGCKVTYVGADKKRFQLEIPESAVKKLGSDYEFQGQRKGFKKFYTEETKAFLERQLQAEEKKRQALQDLRKRIFSKFSERNSDWSAAVECIALLDVLMGLAKYSLSVEGDICTPVFKNVSDISKPYVKVINGKYPCVIGEDNFIPNDTQIGIEEANIMLLTGPNMGGKSTLMRQLGLLIIMAQMGSLVPAECLELSPVDRIFTRIGANDDIMSGESTFYLEMSETSAILHHASLHSLVLIDELGRGTSTYDGTAIAAAVLNKLCTMSCRTIFSTHYHTLVENYKSNSNILLAHMSCMAETEEEETEDGCEENVTFLYKLAGGACPKSYGFNAARLAGVPSHITRAGLKRARQFEQETKERKLFKALFTASDKKTIFSCLTSCDI